MDAFANRALILAGAFRILGSVQMPRQRAAADARVDEIPTDAFRRGFRMLCATSLQRGVSPRDVATRGVAMSIGWGAVADTAVRTQSLRRFFGETRAVDGVDLDVRTGEIYGFLGPNGAGKSTLVHVLCTLLLPTAGRAEVAGFDVARQPLDVRLRIGVALQEASLDPAQSGIELLRLQGRLYGLNKGEIEARLRDLTRLVDIGPALGHRIETYSGGMRRRLDLAAALVHNPQVLFLDEPTTGLDPASRARVWDEVRRLNAEGITIFLTTQYLEEADSLAHRVGIINDGHLITEGTPAELKRSLGSDVIIARVDDGAERACNAVRQVAGVDQVDQHDEELTIRAVDGSAVLSPVAIALDGCGVRVRDLTLREPTLDDVFLELTGEHIQDEEDRSGEIQVQEGE
jgi:ABC-2 type transport system ATP-binding protein